MGTCVVDLACSGPMSGGWLGPSTKHPGKRGASYLFALGQPHIPELRPRAGTIGAAAAPFLMLGRGEGPDRRPGAGGAAFGGQAHLAPCDVPSFSNEACAEIIQLVEIKVILGRSGLQSRMTGVLVKGEAYVKMEPEAARLKEASTFPGGCLLLVSGAKASCVPLRGARLSCALDLPVPLGLCPQVP